MNSQTAYLISLQAAVQIVLLLVVLPPLYRWLSTYKKSVEAANLLLAKGCIAFLFGGCLGMALSPHAVLFVMGNVSGSSSFLSQQAGFPQPSHTFPPGC